MQQVKPHTHFSLPISGPRNVALAKILPQALPAVTIVVLVSAPCLLLLALGRWQQRRYQRFQGHGNHVGGNHVGRFMRTGCTGMLAQVHRLHR